MTSMMDAKEQKSFKLKKMTMRVYIITQVILALWLVLVYDVLEDRRIDDDSTQFKFFFNVLNVEFEPITILC